MTDNEIENEKVFDKDFLGNKINIGDEVIFEAPRYRSFTVGKVVTKAPKSCQIEYVNDWNFPTKGRKMIVRQGYCQIIKKTIETDYDKAIWLAKSETIKEFAEKLKQKAVVDFPYISYEIITVEDIDDVEKELMTEVNENG